jgi:hypothetical protein
MAMVRQNTLLQNSFLRVCKDHVSMVEEKKTVDYFTDPELSQDNRVQQSGKPVEKPQEVEDTPEDEIKLPTDDEIPAEKEKPAPPSSSLPLSIPIKVVLLGLIVAVLIGYVISTSLAPIPIITIDDTPPVPVEISEITAINVYDDGCRVCSKQNSFLTLLTQNNVRVRFADIPISESDARRIVADFNIDQLPVLLVLKESVDEKIMFETVQGKIPLTDALASIGRDALGYFVIEERNFDGKAHTVTLLKTSCNKEDVVTVDLFEDPYSPNTIKFKQSTWEARQRFDQNVAFNYNYLPTTSDQFPFTLRDNAQYLADGLICAADTGNFNSFEVNFYTEYCDLNDNNTLDAGEIEQCGAAGAASIPLGVDALNVLLAESGISPEFFNICQKTRVKDYRVSSTNKAQLFLVGSTPSAVVDCRYKTHPRFLPAVICFSKPDLPGCLQTGIETEEQVTANSTEIEEAFDVTTPQTPDLNTG